MTNKDAWGQQLSGASAAAAGLFGQAMADFRCYRGDPLARLDAALADSPGFVMAHAMRAWLLLLSTEAPAVAVARAALATVQNLPATARERGHLEAIGRLAKGEWQAAGRYLEDVSIEHPRDLLALQVGHQIDFFTGASRMLRDRIARAMPSWSEGMEGYHAVLGMHAFGLEETGLYASAEAAGRHAVALQPGDGWAQHAVAHVMEMQGREREGIAWMRDNAGDWSRDSFFAVHNFWHLALYHLDLGEVAETLRLYDGPIAGTPSAMALDLIDASAMLWRLHLRGIDPGTRWQRLADAWEPFAEAGNYAFNDLHAAIAFIGAGRPAPLQALLRAQERAMESTGDNALFTRAVGAPAVRAMLAFDRGDFAATVRLLRAIRRDAHRFGGSHAQRDLLDLTLIEAALRDGQHSLAAALVAERLDLKPHSPSCLVLASRAACHPPRAA